MPPCLTLSIIRYVSWSGIPWRSPSLSRSTTSLKSQFSFRGVPMSYGRTSWTTTSYFELELQLHYFDYFQTNDLGKRMNPFICLVDWEGCRIHRLPLCRGVRPPPNECPGYDTKQSDGEVLAVLELWEMRSTPSLLLLPGPLWPGVVAPDKGPIYGLNRTNSILMLNWIK